MVLAAGKVASAYAERRIRTVKHWPELGASDVTVGAPATHPAPGFGHGIGVGVAVGLASESEWMTGVAGNLWFVRKFYLSRFRRSASFPEASNFEIQLAGVAH